MEKAVSVDLWQGYILNLWRVALGDSYLRMTLGSPHQAQWDVPSLLLDLHLLGKHARSPELWRAQVVPSPNSRQSILKVWEVLLAPSWGHSGWGGVCLWTGEVFHIVIPGDSYTHILCLLTSFHHSPLGHRLGLQVTSFHQWTGEWGLFTENVTLSVLCWSTCWLGLGKQRPCPAANKDFITCYWVYSFPFHCFSQRHPFACGVHSWEKEDRQGGAGRSIRTRGNAVLDRLNKTGVRRELGQSLPNQDSGPQVQLLPSFAQLENSQIMAEQKNSIWQVYAFSHPWK